MLTITIHEAQSQLAEIIHRLGPGEEVVITENDQPVARLLPAIPEPPKKSRQLGTMRGTVLYIAPDFDAPLEEFREYME
jgi:antitoxin (DNA-binding transcriptional repressor) of toxin-antitoxin stability system